MRVVFIIAILTTLASALVAQSSYRQGLLPSVNLNKKLPNNWKVNFKLESRQIFRQRDFGDTAQSGFTHDRTDISILTSRKVGLNNTAAAGYLIRFRDEGTAHRLIQRFTVNQRFIGFRLAHRLGADQTWADQTSIWRLRYRVSGELPLNGQTVDAREPYLKFNNEYLNVFDAGKYDLEIRVVPGIGYAFTDGNKLEVGLDYRVDSFLEGPTETDYWFNMSWYLAF